MRLREGLSGTGMFLAGMILLILGGVALSLLVDRRFSFSKGKREMEVAIASSKSEIEHLELIRGDLKAKLAAFPEDRASNPARLEELRREIRGKERGLAELTLKQADAGKRIGEVDAEFTAYRAAYQKQVRDAAAGTNLGTFVTRSGREFEDAVIRRVGEDGMEIQHRHGSARIRAGDLQEEYWQKFQWDRPDVPQQVAPATPSAMPAAENREIREAQRTPVKRPTAPSTADSAAVAKARKEAHAWHRKVQALREDAAVTRENLRSSPNASAPGSLETWAARNHRIAVELAKARGEWVRARQRLEDLAPGEGMADPLGPED